ncbi:ParB/RepB/Spo0J family partition protein [Halococcus sp. PRR34]|uniref:ParB/RepB/Spo0J family partition protein n=1 Tax=Halococcus sp. PRR34 TaxID=3020830 RepID=UPI0023613CD4|nr:ParB/RepB/Spo0J family partition protein [Halococcus sp. PRR34]
MAKDPFYYQLDQDYRGTRVRVHTADFTYEGWCRMFHYDQHAVLLYDVERVDGEEVGPVTVNEPETIERIEPGGPIHEIDVDAIQPSPYNAREYDTPDHQEFVKETRDRGHLLTFPAVRPLSDGEYETVGGHKRMEAARRAGLDELPVRVLDLDDWEAARRFVDEHIPVQGASERNMYGQEGIDHALAQLREKWADKRLRDLTPLKPYLEEKLASTRHEAVRQGYAGSHALQ